MKRMALVLAAALAAVGVAQARAAEVPPEVVTAVQALISDGWLAYDPSDPENSGPPPPQPTAAEVKRWQRTGLLKTINITPAKAPDWLIDTEKTEYPAAWCGTGGCLVEIWSPGADGKYVKTLHSQLRLYKVHRLPGKDYGWLETDYHGSVCGLAGVEACPWGYEWRDDGLGKAALRATWRFAKTETLHTGAPPQALDPLTETLIDTPPAPVAAILAANAAACGELKGAAGDVVSADRMPDLNGDGIDDWSYNGTWLQCAYPDGMPVELETFDFCTKLDCGSRIWVSRREGETVRWLPLDFDPNHGYGLRYTPGKAVELVELRDFDEAGPEEGCDTFLIRRCQLKPISLSPNP